MNSTYILWNNTLVPGNVRPSNGLDPQGVAYDPVTGDLYVAEAGANAITVVNATNSDVVDTIPVPYGPGYITYDPASDTVDVGYPQSATMNVISAANNTVVANVSLPFSGPSNTTPGAWVTAFAPAPSLGIMFVATETSVDVLDSATYKITGTFHTGAFSDGLAYDVRTGHLYVANVSGSELRVLDPKTGNLLGTVPAGSNPTTLAVDPSTGSLWVANWGSANITVIDPLTDRALASISVGRQPESLIFGAGSRSVFIGNYGWGNVTTVNSSRMTIVGSVNIGYWAGAFAFDSTNGSVFAVDFDGGTLTQLDGTNGTVERTTVLGTQPDALAVDPAPGQLVIGDAGQPYLRELATGNGSVDHLFGATNATSAMALDPLTDQIWSISWGAQVVVTDASNGTHVTTLPVGFAPLAIAYDPALRAMVVSSSVPSNLSFFNASTGRLIASVPVPGFVFAIGVDPRSGEVYAGGDNIGPGANTADLWRVNLTTARNLTTLAPVVSGPNLNAVLVDPPAGQVYIAGSAPNNITAVNLTDGQILTNISVGLDPYALEVDPSGRLLFVANWGSSNLTVIDTTTDRAIGLIAVGLWPSALAFDNGSGRLFVANWASGTVSNVAPASAPAEYPVRFQESGLPSGLTWAVSLAYQSRSTSGTTLEFSEPNGAGYAYTVVPPPGYVDSPASGTVDVAGGTELVPLLFTAAPGPFTVMARGTPSAVDLGQAVSFTCGASGGVALYSYSWSFGDGSLASVPDPTHTYPAAGPYSATCGVSDSQGLVTSYSLSVSIRPDPTVLGPTASDLRTDVGGQIGFTAVARGGSGGYNATWSGLPAGCSLTPSLYVPCTARTAGSYVVGIEVTDSSGFSAFGTNLTVQVAPAPEVSSITVFPAEPASGQEFSIAVHVTGGTPPFLYRFLVVPTGCDSAVGSILSCHASSPGQYPLRVTVIDHVGGAARAMTNITVVPGSAVAGLAGAVPWLLAALAVAAAAGIIVFVAIRRRRRWPPPPTVPGSTVR